MMLLRRKCGTIRASHPPSGCHAPPSTQPHHLRPRLDVDGQPRHDADDCDPPSHALGFVHGEKVRRALLSWECAYGCSAIAGMLRMTDSEKTRSGLTRAERFTRKDLGVVRVYLNELEDVEAILRASCERVEITTTDHDAATVHDLMGLPSSVIH